MKLRLIALVSVLAALLVLPAAAPAQGIVKLKGRYEVVKASVTITYEWSGRLPNPEYHAHGTEVATLTLLRPAPVRLGSFQALMTGPVKGSYTVTGSESSLHCDAQWDVARHKADLGMTFVQHGRTRATVGGGMSFGDPVAFGTTLDEACSPEGQGATAGYIGKTIDLDYARIGGFCEGYTLGCDRKPTRFFKRRQFTIRTSGTDLDHHAAPHADDPNAVSRRTWSAEVTFRRVRR
jgi:hypothetical protein